MSLNAHSCSIRPIRLHCQHLEEALGLNTDKPIFSWALEWSDMAKAKGKAVAWRLVASQGQEDVKGGIGSLWDSGKQDGCPDFVKWGGARLPADLTFWWSVQIWDENGSVSDFAAPARVMTGLGRDDWDASWIGRYFVLPAGRDIPQDNLYDNRFQARPADYLRKEITLESQPVRATVYLSALGLYEFYINGTRIGSDVMAPGWTDYHKRVEYQCHDVSAHLKAGANCLGAIIGEGWYSGRVGHNQRRAGNHYGGRPALICQLHLEYADGRVERFFSDGSWVTRQGPICYSDFLAGEMYDARLSLDDWCVAGLSTVMWQPVEEIIPEPGCPHLDASRCQPAREVARLDPESIKTVGENSFIYDFGHNLAGYVELTIEADEGTRFTLRHGERLDDTGALYTANLRYAVSEDIYIARGAGIETFRPRFTFHGFQYVELTIEGGNNRPPRLAAIAIQTNTPVCGSIETGHPMVNQLLSNIFWSQRDNFLSVPTDCPQRDERYGWSADAQVFWKTAGYFMDVSAFLNKWMEDLIDGQSPEGAFPDVAPTKPLNPYRLTPQPGAPAWGDAPIIMAWHHYLRYGDRAMLERCWEPFCAWMTYIESHNPGGIRCNQVNNNYGDWLSIGPETNRDLLNSAYWIHLADLMGKIARVIGRNNEPWQRLAARLRDIFAKTFWQPEGTLKGDTQTAYLLALDFKILPANLEPIATDRLVKLIKAADGHLQTGFLGVRHLCPVLSDHGAASLAVDLLLKDSYPSWGFSIKHGATTIWERWDGWTEEKGFQSTAMNSFNHYAYGAVGEWIWSRLAGFDWEETAPGFRKLLIRPVFDPRIGWLNASYDAQSGRIESHWRYDNGHILWTVTLAPNVTAQVVLPPDLTSEKGNAFELGSGTHALKIVNQSDQA
ncbi:family 78 glycoside hydrolase catalytic domain [uncultured Cohaesibacter sp.]|uniref:family 78 glycoside hydrolase catalytic domain n=1 Tax=uncultured Cohaesibacter sp. TaxID=1002546 RepID=UPI0029302875|nr:family 78 glycoside hydrolase catalytic domain [uncultured Cohaesibacter sp.]